MKILQFTEKMLMLLGLCTRKNNESFLSGLRYTFSTFSIIAVHSYFLTFFSIKYIFEHLGDYSEYNFAVFQIIAGTSICASVVLFAIKRNKVRHVIDTIQELINKSK